MLRQPNWRTPRWVLLGGVIGIGLTVPSHGTGAVTQCFWPDKWTTPCTSDSGLATSSGWSLGRYTISRIKSSRFSTGVNYYYQHWKYSYGTIDKYPSPTLTYHSVGTGTYYTDVTCYGSTQQCKALLYNYTGASRRFTASSDGS